MAADRSGSSLLARFFRRLADFFERRASKEAHHTRILPGWAGTRVEIDLLAFGLLFLGISVGGIAIHGFSNGGWILLLALAVSAGAWFLFFSARFTPLLRDLEIALLLVLAIPAAIERIMALAAFVLLFLLLLARQRRSSAARRENTVSVIAVILFCFVSYEVFAIALEASRNRVLKIPGALYMSCEKKQTEICSALEVRFDVPEFWQPGYGSNLIRDLNGVASLRIFKDSATDNQIAFAAYSSTPHQIATALQNFLITQKNFLRSRKIHTTRGPNMLPLNMEKVMESSDTQLYSLSYSSTGTPEYLGDEVQSTAFLVLHQRHGTTWLFILDGTDYSGREFLLHRIISGFR